MAQGVREGGQGQGQGKGSGVQGELKRWEMLGAAAKKGPATDRTSLGSSCRQNLTKLKQDMEGLQRRLDNLPKQGATEKTITQWKDELAKALQEVHEMHARAKPKPSTAAPVASAGSFTGADVPSTGSFTKLDGGGGRGNGAELQSMSDAELLSSQQQTMRNLDDMLLPLQGTMDRLQEGTREIHRTISSQNSSLQTLNDRTDRAMGRMDRLKQMVSKVMESGRNRCLVCTVLVLVVILVFLIVKLLMP